MIFRNFYLPLTPKLFYIMSYQCIREFISESRRRFFTNQVISPREFNGLKSYEQTNFKEYSVSSSIPSSPTTDYIFGGSFFETSSSDGGSSDSGSSFDFGGGDSGGGGASGDF